MTIRDSLRQGARSAASNKRILVVYYLCNVAAAAVIVAPVAMVMARLLSHSLENARLFASFAPGWLVETGLSFNFTPAVGMIPILVITTLLYLLLNTFLAGGAIAVFYRPNESFFACCGRYSPRFFRILLLSLPLYGLGYGIAKALDVARSRWSEDSMREAPGLIALWVILAFALLLLFAVNMIFDYAKIVCVVEDRKALRSVWRALRFTWRNPRSTYGLFLTTIAIGLVFLGVYHGLSEWIDQDSRVAIVAVFLIRQLYIVVRFWIRLWTWGSEIALYAGLSPKPVPPVVEEFHAFEI